MDRQEKLAIRQRGGARKLAFQDDLILADSPKASTQKGRVSSTKKAKKSLVDSLKATKNLVNTSKDFLDTPTKKLQNSSGNSSRRSSSARKNRHIALDRFNMKPKTFIDDDYKDISSVFEDSDISFSFDTSNNKNNIKKKTESEEASKESHDNILGDLASYSDTLNRTTISTEKSKKPTKGNNTLKIMANNSEIEGKLSSIDKQGNRIARQTSKKIAGQHLKLRRSPRRHQSIQETENKVIDQSLMMGNTRKLQNEPLVSKSRIQTSSKNLRSISVEDAKKLPKKRTAPSPIIANSTPQRRSKRIQGIQDNARSNVSIMSDSEASTIDDNQISISDKKKDNMSSSLEQILEVTDDDSDSDFEIIEEKDKESSKAIEKKTSEKKISEKKQVTINIARLNTDKQVKLNALDITISAIVEFLKNQIKQNSDASKSQIIEKYLNVIYQHLLNLLDSNLLVLSLNSGLRALNQRKLNLRHQIVNLQIKNSKIMNHELILLRNNNVRLFNFENNMKQLRGNLTNLRNKRNTTRTNNDSELDHLLFKLNGIVNPGWSIIQKLESLNESLKNLDKDLSSKLSE